MSETVLTNARLILPDHVQDGHIVIRDGMIAAIGSGPARGDDMQGDFIAPGLVELHTDNLEQHLHPRPHVEWPHAPAILAHDAELAATGITTVFDALRVGSIPWRANYTSYARPLSREIAAIRQAGLLRISHHLHLRAEICSETLVEELAEFAPDDRVRLVSLMDHTPGQRQFRDLGLTRKFVSARAGMTEAGFDIYRQRLVTLRADKGPANEAAALDFARRVGAVLASHDDTTSAHVAQSAAHGVALAEFPTTAEAAQSCRDHGIAIIMGAPNLVRGGSHSGNVDARELAGAGLLDIVSSDYIPAALLAAAARLARLWDDLPRAMATVTANPARAAGLDDRGRLAPGLRADLIRFRLHEGMAVLRETHVAGKRVA
ncbi:alpha-D-ribose 1-methylphosphonate 5-triphosphate diphosphatase [Paracoccus spongiarum]|uniref:Alpha-D-ribose 1-methylphosphonate 5-triphosphate diphosphatase n=1 Tax=Paracoccus spongiarum TaxID=3064387 RepID=A0ABT9JCX5_9RHOB|nr:alpha-D-ribose 1-methylphosphonate 5-triphosphate diphosphatase [Paracoccus sp. 2205BS29-5]MDP5307677.1 alpha-D-ribose 1-methylphosphonate 5-triphosphate diphosphatase [Paracoccus sp. 2205BS29-5]